MALARSSYAAPKMFGTILITRRCPAIERPESAQPGGMRQRREMFELGNQEVQIAVRRPVSGETRHQWHRRFPFLVDELSLQPQHDAPVSAHGYCSSKISVDLSCNCLTKSGSKLTASIDSHVQAFRSTLALKAAWSAALSLPNESTQPMLSTKQYRQFLMVAILPLSNSLIRSTKLKYSTQVRVPSSSSWSKNPFTLAQTSRLFPRPGRPTIARVWCSESGLNSAARATASGSSRVPSKLVNFSGTYRFLPGLLSFLFQRFRQLSCTV